VSSTLNIREVSGLAIVDVSGRITLGESASTLRDTLRQMARSGQRKILLNLANVTYLDSSGIGVLVSSFATINSLGGHLKLLKLTERVKDLLVITKLYTVFEVYDNEATAINSFGTASTHVPVAGR